MCTLVNELPQRKKRKRRPSERLNFIKLEETLNAKKPYRFRLLYFKNPELNDRSTPFVVKQIHETYWTNDEGKSMYNFVTCPSTNYVKWDSNPYETCPMCVNANGYFKSLQASQWKDQDIKQEFDSLKSKRIVLIPVYVVSDPNNPKNNNTFAVFVIKEKDIKYTKNEQTGKWDSIDPYEQIESMIDECRASGTFPFNTNAVDLAIWMEGHTFENKRTGKTTKYSKIGNMKLTTKPYEIEAITGEALKSDFGTGFDEDCYTIPTNEDLNAYFEKHIGTSLDIPDDDLGDIDDTVDVQVSTTVEKSKVVEQVVEKVENDIDFDNLDDLDDIDIDDVIDTTVTDATTEDDVPMDFNTVSEPSKTSGVDELDDLSDLDDILGDLD